MRGSKKNAVEMRGIVKRFPGVLANDNIDFRVKDGEVHGLLGENGAGKSTLMEILYGRYSKDEGEIYLQGEKVDIKNAKDAMELGIGMVHQHFMLIPKFSIAENIVLGKEPEKNNLIDEEEGIKKVKEIADEYGLRISDPSTKIRDIPVGKKQRAEILKTLYRGAEILILDEPTAVLTPQEIESLYKIIEELKASGKTIILITHKLNEALTACDRVTVLREGKKIDTVKTENTNSDKLAEMMVGREVLFDIEKEQVTSGEVTLSVKDLKAKNDRGIMAVNGASFNLKKGEILGLAGVQGNGQTELEESLWGTRKIEGGKIELENKDITDYPPKEKSKTGIAYIPEDRLKSGLITELDLTENTMLGLEDKYIKNQIMIDYPKWINLTEDLIEDFDVRAPGPYEKAGKLSGGNQQKLLVGREFYKDPEVIIASQPTRGLDVGSIEYIHKRLLDMRSENKAVLLISTKLDEILTLSDRIAVIYEGKIVDVRPTEEYTKQELGLLMTGKSSGEESEEKEKVEI